MVNTLRICEKLFRQFKSGGFNVKDKKLQVLLDDDPTQTTLSSIWITHWSKNDQNGPRDMEKWFCYMTMPRLTHENWRKKPWNRLDGTSFRPRYNSLTWWHLSITSSHQWDTCLQSSSSAISKKCENGSTNVLPQNKKSFSGEIFITCLKDGRSL